LVTGNTSAGKSSKLKKLYDRAQDQLPELKRKQQKFLDKWLATAKETSTGRPIDGLLTPPAPITACHNAYTLGTFSCSAATSTPSMSGSSIAARMLRTSSPP
jgi:hypothetical protein